ncbi:MAG: lipopolysaccharide biosynthesis protein [Rhodospirillales bacterium]|nr:lipopolysaccharide biosynthesis protein [Rhodospirillales bacterium]
MALALVTAAILARLLAPADFGLIAMGATVTSFVGLFSGLGLSAAIVQREVIDQDTVERTLAVECGDRCWSLAIAIAAAPTAASLYDEPRLKWIIPALALPLPIAAAGAQHLALLQRGMRWLSVQSIEILSQVAGATAAVALAWKTDLGYWALVIQGWAAVVVTVVMVWILCPWRPSLTQNWGHAAPALRFGLYLTGFNFLNYFHRSFDNVLIGWRWHATELGFYTRAYALFMMPLTAIAWPLSAVVVPAMSRAQGEPARWKRLYLTSLAATVVVTTPFSCLLYLSAEPLVLVVYGAKWEPVVAILQALSVCILVQPIYTSGGWIYASLGTTRRLFWAGIPAALWFCAAFGLGVQYGV